jgi:hypothetical protein
MKPSALLLGVSALTVGFLLGGALMETNWVAVADPEPEWVFGVIGLALLFVPCWLFNAGLLSRLARWLISIAAVGVATCAFGIGFILYYMRKHPIS